jgi:hypothetical protein
MNTSPSIDSILEGVIMTIDDEIIPALDNPKAHASAQMIQSLLQGLRQTLPVFDASLVDEHNDMIRTLRDAAAALGDAAGSAADRVRERAQTFGSWSELPAPSDRDDVVAAHTELGRAIEASFLDLDELQRAGVAAADDAVQVIRTHLGPRYVREAATIMVGEGMLGRN